ncbi:hypothetical protein QBC39DRAFT_342776 [Podospora conica]|nr:hypothetical protein QBC39DRAFT_342776 [Schizothecium conicum]
MSLTESWTHFFVGLHTPYLLGTWDSSHVPRFPSTPSPLPCCENQLDHLLFSILQTQTPGTRWSQSERQAHIQRCTRAPSPYSDAWDRCPQPVSRQRRQPRVFAMNLIQAYLLGLSPQRCPVCSAVTSDLLPCDSCRAVSYCCPSHQSADQPKHQPICNKIKKTREKLEEEMDRVVAIVPQEHVPAGQVWSLPNGPNYLTARSAAAKALLEASTLVSLQQALDHFRDMLRLDRNDNMMMRNYVPGVLLRLGREQVCYDFLFRWNHGRHSFGDSVLPYTDGSGGTWDAFGPVGSFLKGGLSLSQLVGLTLLKLRLYLDLQAVEQRLGSMLESMSGSGKGYSNHGSALDRPLGQIVKGWVQSPNRPNISETAQQIKAQYLTLCRRVHDSNKYFWKALIDTETPTLTTGNYEYGSPLEAEMVVYHCKASWRESEGALGSIKTVAAQWSSAGAGDSCAQRPVDDSHTQPLVAVPRKTVPLRRGTGIRFASEFFAPRPSTTPGDLFNLHPSPGGRGAARFLHHKDQSSILLYTDGACLNNGHYNPSGGWAVAYGPGNTVSGRLEANGPFGHEYEATSNRAELRAVIAALRLSDWRGEGFDSITIATDSRYIVSGTTEWIRSWFYNGWKTGTGLNVKNKDLWELLQGEIERWAAQGLAVKFWKIPRDWNTVADYPAKKGASKAWVAKFDDVSILPQVARSRVLALCLEHEDLFDKCFGSLVKTITSKAKLDRATTPEAAIRMLTDENIPSTILITDAAITRQRAVFKLVANCLARGTTVVLCGLFSSMVNVNDFRCFMAELGLTWTFGSYARSTVSLSQYYTEIQTRSGLPKSYIQKAQFVKTPDRSPIWYAGKNSGEGAVAFAKVRQGRLGYIGDVNGEEESTAVVMAMCGLLD